MRILLVKTSSLGDVIHNLPVASDVAARFPEAVIDWVVEESFADIPRLHPRVGRVIPVAIRRWRRNLLSRSHWHEMGAFRAALNDRSYDVVLDTQGLIKSSMIGRLARLSACGHRYGFGPVSAKEPLAARFYDRRFEIAREQHAVERNRQLAAAAFGYGLGGLPLDYGIQAPPLQADWLSRPDYAVLLTATSGAYKLWPEVDWLALGTALIAAGLTCVLPGGTAEERSRAERLARRLGHAIVVPPLNLPQLAGLLAGAHLVVGVDTGLLHLAAALGRPTLGLYRGTDPLRTGVLADGKLANLGSRGAAPSAGEAVRHALALIG